MKAFISYCGEDKVFAEVVAWYFALNGVPYTWDQNYRNLPTKDPYNLTDTIHSAISDCTHLIVLLTKKTKDSLWVPYELGYGIAKELLAVTYGVEYKEMPGYLQVWPNLASIEQLDKFIANFKSLREKEGSLNLTASDSMALFYMHMKDITGQLEMDD